MVKIYCDYCKKQIDSWDEDVNLSFSAFGCTGFNDKEEYQLHIDCAKQVREKLRKLFDLSVNQAQDNVGKRV